MFMCVWYVASECLHCVCKPVCTYVCVRVGDVLHMYMLVYICKPVVDM